MRGQIMDYNLQKGQGLISGDDGNRYTFDVSEWKQDAMPARGQKVDFDAQDGTALQIYKMASAGVSGEKNKWIAAVLAFVLGGFGAHKFYLGYNNAGFIMLAMFIGGWVTSIIIIGLLPLLAVSLIAFVEFIIYIITDEDEFEQRYVVNQRPWF